MSKNRDLATMDVYIRPHKSLFLFSRSFASGRTLKKGKKQFLSATKEKLANNQVKEKKAFVGMYTYMSNGA